MPACSDIPDITFTHPDMLGFYHNKKLYLNCDYYKANKKFFDEINTQIVLCNEPYGKYPDDVRFNCIAVDDTLISHTISTPNLIKKSFSKIINVNQGYTKCSTLVMGKAFVTADDGIYHTLLNLGYDCLKISQGGVMLKGFDYGFIGGAVCDIGENNLISFGSLDTHPYSNEIKIFANKHSYDIIDFKFSPLYDYGGVIVCYD